MGLSTISLSALDIGGQGWVAVMSWVGPREEPVSYSLVDG